ncbi:MAG: protein translocase subunit SecD [Pirellulales bacterium]|nr:protein translocase subunit SecD [Pirellulales bacterium]
MDVNSLWTLLWIALVLLMLIGPFMLGGYVARMLRMPDYGWKISLILFTLIVSVSMIALKWPPKFGIDLSGGVILIYEIDQEQLARDKKELADVDIGKLVDAIKLRVNPGGQKEVTIRPYGPTQIEIIIPNVTEVELKRVKEIVSQTGKLEFRIVANTHKHKTEIEMARNDPEKMAYPDTGKNWIARWYEVKQGEQFGPQNLTRKRTVGKREFTEVLVVNDVYDVTGDFLTSSRPGNEYGKPCVLFGFNAKGGQLFGALTSDNRPQGVQENKNQLGIILDGIMYSAPNIQTTITDNGQITGNFTQKEVDDIVEVLNAGSLPAALAKTPVQELNTGAMLGQDTIRKSSYALIFSAIVVVVFMVVYYRFSGIIAVIALALNILGIVAVMITFNAAFTLTGFAALALTVGMAVDNNVLVYERMREELAKGAALRMAIRNAFNRVGSTIIDCNMTHVIVGVVLWVMGSDQMRGFAVPLLMGVLFSMFTAVFVSHVLFDIAERHHWIAQLKMMHVIGHTSIDFMGVFPVCLAISIILTTLGLGASIFRGKGLLDIDFTGGVSVQVQFEKPHDTEQVRAALKDEVEMPDLALSELRIGEEDEGLRFNVNTSRERGLSDKEPAPELVKKFIQKKFGSELLKNELTWTNLGPAVPKKAGPKMPAAEQIELQAPAEPMEKEKPPSAPAGGKTPEKPASDKQSQRLPRSSHWLAAVAAAPLLFGQVEAASGQPPAAPPAAAQAADAKSEGAKIEDANSADPKPADAKTEENKAAEQKPEEIKSSVSPVEELAAASDPFRGGSQVELNFKEPIDHEQVGAIVAEALQAAGLKAENVRREIAGEGFIEGDPNTLRTQLRKWELRLALPPAEAKNVLDAAAKKLSSEPFFPASNAIGGAVAGSTRLQALWAIIASWALIILYLWIRFQGVAFGLAAVIALVHDVLVALGGIAFSYWLAQLPGVSQFLLIDQFKINLSIIAAFLTIIGYSVNDTIVVFDRIREIRGKDPYLTRKMVNDATNQTLSRTIITSLTVFMVVVVLYVAGGPALRGFSFALTIGVLTGTYSSIYVAAPILLWLVGKHQVTAEHPHYEAK